MYIIIRLACGCAAPVSGVSQYVE